jgi:hypothetical protein
MTVEVHYRDTVSTGVRDAVGLNDYDGAHPDPVGAFEASGYGGELIGPGG